MHFIVALTGGIGSGKSTVADAFARFGVTIVDADVIARRVVEPGTPALKAIIARFGAEVRQADGALDRRALRQRIFSSEDDKIWLNGLLHPLIQQHTAQQFDEATGDYVLWVVPLLVENQLQHRANRVLVVDVAVETQINRTLKRDGVDRRQITRILAAQATREQRLAIADDIIDNNGNPDDIVERVAALHRCYQACAASATRQD